MNSNLRESKTAPWSSGLPLAALIARAVEKHGATPLHFHTQAGAYTCTTESLLHDAKEIGKALTAVGLRRGDVIAIQLPTQRETALLYLAALEIGAVLVPIVHIYGPAEVGFILRQSRARVLCVPDFWSRTDYLERVAALGDTPPTSSALSSLAIGRPRTASRLARCNDSPRQRMNNALLTRQRRKTSACCCTRQERQLRPKACSTLIAQ
ncbi:acyl-CoA synthetase (AMP-forming)/AMP-acid ligase II [Paraburkholderia sp. 40]